MSMSGNIGLASGKRRKEPSTPAFVISSHCEDVHRAVRRATRFLEGQQRPDGSFPSVFWRLGQSPEAADELFVTASVLLAAGSVLRAETARRAGAFIAERRLSNGFWRFESSPSHLPLLPPDADCTACCLAALVRLGVGNIEAHDVALLRCFWRPYTGPFRTWLENGLWGERRFDDAVVNCNVLLGFSALGVPASVEEWSAVQELALQDRPPTPFYPSWWTLAYSARRAGVIFAGRDAGLEPTSALEAAQALAAKGGREAKLTRWLLSEQRPDGGWSAEPWFRDHWGTYGSAALSTAIAIEALAMSIENGERVG
jgi:hypothetical protein